MAGGQRWPWAWVRVAWGVQQVSTVPTRDMPRGTMRWRRAPERGHRTRLARRERTVACRRSLAAVCTVCPPARRGQPLIQGRCGARHQAAHTAHHATALVLRDHLR